MVSSLSFCNIHKLIKLYKARARNVNKTLKIRKYKTNLTCLGFLKVTSITPGAHINSYRNLHKQSLDTGWNDHIASLTGCELVFGNMRPITQADITTH